VRVDIAQGNATESGHQAGSRRSLGRSCLPKPGWWKFRYARCVTRLSNPHTLRYQ